MATSIEAVEGILRDAARHFQEHIPRWRDEGGSTYSFVDALDRAYEDWAPEVPARAQLVETLKQMGIRPGHRFESSDEEEHSWDHMLAGLVDNALYAELGRRHPDLKQLESSF